MFESIDSVIIPKVVTKVSATGKDCAYLGKLFPDFVAMGDQHIILSRGIGTLF